MQYYNLTSEKVPLFWIFILWMYASHPDIIVLSAEQKETYKVLIRALDPRNRGSFLQMLETAEQVLYTA